MKMLCITDPLTHPPTDTTVALYNCLAVDPRFDFFHLEAGRVGDGTGLSVTRVPRALAYEEFLALAQWPVERAEFGDFDLTYSRADRPYPPGYLDALVRHEDETRFVARPSSIRDQADRGFCRRVAERHMPPGILTRSIDQAEQFIQAQGKVVAKKNQSYGGKGVTRIWSEGTRWCMEGVAEQREERSSLGEILLPLFASDTDPFEFVRYLENVSMGDKRVLVVEGDIYGAVLRVAPNGGWINNITSGAIPHPATVTAREEEIIQATCSRYHELGLYALGYDFLVGDTGEWILSEINSGNTGGYGSIERLSGRPVFSRFLDWLALFSAR